MGGTLLFFLIGLVLLGFGASMMVRGAAGLALRFGTPPLIIGLTVVAFGTSSPEVLVSLQAAHAGDPEIALGNVIGSNIFNVLFILGLSATIAPLVVSERLVRRDVPVMVGVSFLVYLLCQDGQLSRLDGVLLLTGIVTYVGALIWRTRRARPGEMSGDAGVSLDPSPGLMRDAVRITLGLALQVIGARWLVRGAIDIATSLGVSELVIGLTVVAAGTSLPEVATSVAASLRGERDIAVGNVVGSNIFNLLLVLGCAALYSPGGFPIPPGALDFDLPIMLAVALACLPIFVTGFSIQRWEGAVFLGYYVAYTTFLVLDATGHSAAPIFGGFVVLFVVPLTVITFIVMAVRTSRRKARRDPALRDPERSARSQG